MAPNYYFGRPAEKMSCHESIEANLKLAEEAIEVAKLLYGKYVKEYRTIICPHIHVQLFGRHYYFGDPDDSEKFEKTGVHSGPTKCGHIVGNAARWTMEILLDKCTVRC